MSWKLLDRPKTQKATKALAKSFAEMEPAPHDRPLSERRLAVYQKLLNSGQFRPVTWASAVCHETGDVYRVNGKHTSVLLSGLEKIPDFYITIEEYECDTLDDVARLYATFDSSMQSRSAKDIYLSFAGTVPALEGISSTIIGAVATGVAYQKFGQDSYKTQPAERAEYLLEYSDFAVWLSELVAAGGTQSQTGSRSTQKCRHMLKKPIVAAIFGSYLKAKGAALEFWSAVRDETGVTPDLPDRKLAKFLLLSGTIISRGGKTANDIKKAGDRETYVKCLHAWNAWRKGEPTNLKYTAAAKVPAIY